MSRHFGAGAFLFFLIYFCMLQKLFATLICSVALSSFAADKQCFDFDWKFIKSDSTAFAEANYNESAWTDVQLPHDWNISDTFDINIGGHAAYLPEGIGWYRKTFTVPRQAQGQKVAIHFDGIFMQSDVYVNGHHLGYRPYGFCSIEYDLTPYLNFNGKNTIAVRVNTTGDRPRWYAGAGIYRHTWLVTANNVHVATYGTYITTPNVSNDRADVNIVTTVQNSSENAAQVALTQRILSPEGREINKTTQKITLAAGNSADFNQTLAIASPQLWDIDSPVLYQMETTIKQGGKIIDKYITPFGVRTFHFDPQTGFWLNGKHIKLKGLCLHQDAGAMGVAVPDDVYERRLRILKQYGCNAIRMAHNQPSPEVLDMCDRMGFVVIDEAFDKWKSGYYEKYFDQWWQADMADMILRDRNHPSIILWSIGNELQEAWRDDNEGVERASMLQDFVHKLEPTRPVTLAAQNNHQSKFSAVVDVSGYNYLEARAISEHAKHPQQCFLISEELPYYSGEEGNIRAYSTLNPWNLVRDNDFFAGGFIWSGVDYLGEAGWPGKGWPNGLFDICIDEKPRAAYHRAMWNDEPIVRIAVLDNALNIEHGRDLWQWPKMAAHWNFPWNYEGLIMQVSTITNCQEVELVINDKVMGRNRTADFANNNIIWNIPYTPGSIEAVGYNDGKEVARHKLVTSGKTDNCTLTVSRHSLSANGTDVAFIELTLTDKDGNKVSTDDRKVTVNIEGEARLLALDNGDLRRENTFHTNTLPTYFGRALCTVQASRHPGTARITINIDGISQPYIVNFDIK
jgi:beta-galactosidase